MLSIHLIAVFTILLLVFCYRHLRFQTATPGKNTTAFGNSRLSKYLLPMLFAAALLLRLLFAYFYHGFDTDISCFAAWADRIFKVGPTQFYSADIFTDYPPGFMYILYVIGAVCSLLRIPYLSGLHLLLLKLPAVLCDIGCGFLLYKTARKKASHISALFLTLIYLFNPAVILNSAVWGQVDSVYTLTLVLMCLYLIAGKMLPAYIAYGLGVLLKPQMLVFTPVLLAGILDHVFLRAFSPRKLLQNLFQGIGVLLGMLLLCLPFGLDRVFTQYAQTLGSYPYAAVNAYNFGAFLV